MLIGMHCIELTRDGTTQGERIGCHWLKFAQPKPAKLTKNEECWAY